MNIHPDLQRLTLLKSIHEYGDVHSFYFAPEKKLNFRPGMYAHVRLPDGEEGQRTREFSVASAPREEHVLISTHLREESAYKRKFAELAEGDVVEIFKIKGNFLLPDDESTEVVLIAGGIGITPMRSMLIESNADDSAATPILIHVADGNYLYESELSALPNQQKRISSKEVGETLRETVGRHPHAAYFVSGSPGFVATTAHLLKELQISDGRIIVDEFSGYMD